MMKKLFAFALAMAMTVSLAINTGAYNDTDSTSNSSCVVYEQDGIKIEMTEVFNPPIIPRNTLLNLTHYEGMDDYQKTIYPTAAQGNAINIFIDNSKGKGDLHPMFDLNGTEFNSPQLTLGSGRMFTYTLTREDKGGISGSLFIRVTTYDEKLNFDISARQYFL